MSKYIMPLVLLIAISMVAAAGVFIQPSEAQEALAARSLHPSSRGNGQAGAIGHRAENLSDFETIKISAIQGSDNRYPGVCENVNGDRLVIFVGPDKTYWYSTCKKDDAWSTPETIPGQPKLSSYTCVDVETDSAGRFHCVWEQPQITAVYATFLDGTWTTPVELPSLGQYDMSSAIAVRSNDEVAIVNGQVIFTSYLTKDVVLNLKGRDETEFRSPINLTQDHESSAMPHVAVDANDHLWVVDKSDLNMKDDILIIILTEWDENNNLVDDWINVSSEDGWCFWPQVAVNNEGKVMTAWAHSQSGDYWSRIFDSTTKTLSPQLPLRVGLSTNPWATFYSKLVAHGKDFYIAALNPARTLFLLKFVEQQSEWQKVAEISDRPVQYFDVYSGYDKILVAWGEMDAPADVYLTAVSVAPAPSLRPSLTIQASPGGTTIPSPGRYKYVKGTLVTVQAVPFDGYLMNNWSGDASGDAASITVAMDADKTVKANFIPIPKPPLDLILSTGLDDSWTQKINTLTWHRNPGNTGLELTGYGIYRKRADRPDADFVKIASADPEAYAYVDGGLPLNQRFTYRLTTIPKDSFGKESNKSEPASEGSVFPPLAVACRTVFNNSLFRKEKINIISWQGSPLNEGVTIAQYDIYRKVAGQEDSAYRLIASVAGSAVEFRDRMLSFDERYVYAIKSIDTGGAQSGISNPARE